MTVNELKCSARPTSVNMTQKVNTECLMVRAM